MNTPFLAANIPFLAVNTPFSRQNWMTLFGDLDIFFKGLQNTLIISACSLVFTLAIGILVGVALQRKRSFITGLCRAYMSFFQNTPLLMQIFVFYNVLPKLGIRLSVPEIGIWGLSLYTGAYAADIVHSAIQAVPVGQKEAAISQGLSSGQTLVRVVLPQAVKVGLPAMANQAVNLIKNSSVMASIAGGELMYQADVWSGSNLIYGPTFVVTGLLYLSICFPVSMLARYLEKRSMKDA